jgi:hypothetical protein
VWTRQTNVCTKTTIFLFRQREVYDLKMIFPFGQSKSKNYNFTQTMQVFKLKKRHYHSDNFENMGNVIKKKSNIHVNTFIQYVHVQKYGFCQWELFYVSHLLRDRTSVYKVSYEGPLPMSYREIRTRNVRITRLLHRRSNLYTAPSTFTSKSHKC